MEYQIVALREKVESLEMKKIKNDLKEVEDENEELAKRLKGLKKQLKKRQRLKVWLGLPMHLAMLWLICVMSPKRCLERQKSKTVIWFFQTR